MDEQEVKSEENKGTKITISEVTDTADTKAAERPIVNDITPPPAPEEDSSTTEAEVEAEEATPPAPSEPSETEESSDALASEPEDEPEEVYVESAPDASEPLVEAPSEEPNNDEAVSEQVTSVLGQETTEPEVPAEVPETPQLEAPSQESSDTPSTLPDGAMATVGMAASQMNKPPHRNNKKLAAIVTIFAALILAGVAVFVYLSANTNTAEDTTKAAPVENSTAQTVAPVVPATTADVDSTNSAVDEALNSLDEAADFADADLSDTSLGL